MSKSIPLTPTQQAILSHAIQHSDGRIEWFPDNVKGGARQKVIDGLFNRALITPEGKQGWCVAAEGYDALGVPRPVPQQAARSFEAKLDIIIANAEASQNSVQEAEPGLAKDTTRTRANSKQAQVIAMLQRPEGASIEQIMQATEWQQHTVRGFFAGALKKKLGLQLASDKVGDVRIYRLPQANVETAAGVQA
ncbi:DUF3489 domain-containing protein [Ottowia testudinis]|uniref:DUF3489 domain-containing protein n=1 Tax=Ottowia testudinis TaxID=2816950 RepID=A0A975H2M9_9BURK|nr:DUF3489 domain-containing protein [Ottowia testudinis]QTD44371.1 DUF3489 domain-containing protein [Ottowia testudinis]